MRILCSLGAVSLDALLNLGMRDGKHAVYEVRKGVVFAPGLLSRLWHEHNVSQVDRLVLQKCWYSVPDAIECR